MKDLEARKEAARFVTWADGGEERKLVAFIQNDEDGSFGGCASIERYRNDDRFGVLKHKITTNGKYTKWKYGLITSNEL